MFRKPFIILLAVFFAIAVTSSCKKTDIIYPTCYECQNVAGSDSFHDVGCHSTDAWLNIILTDNTGATIDKGMKCRKK